MEVFRASQWFREACIFRCFCTHAQTYTHEAGRKAECIPAQEGHPKRFLDAVRVHFLKQAACAYDFTRMTMAELCRIEVFLTFPLHGTLHPERSQLRTCFFTIDVE